jgi:hypothetical protein
MDKSTDKPPRPDDGSETPKRAGKMRSLLKEYPFYIDVTSFPNTILFIPNTIT